MKYSRKVVTVAGLIAVSMLAVSGCSGTSSTGDASPSTTDGATVDAATDLAGTLSIASWQFLEPERGDLLLASVKKYGDENADATVEKVEFARADYEKTLSTQLGAGQGPDILVIPDAFFPQLAEAGLLEPLDDVVAAADPTGFRDVNAAYTQDDSQLAVAWEIVPYALFWNKTILESAGVEAPTNVEELIAAENEITAKTGTTGFTVRHQLAEETPWWTDQSNWEFGFGGAWSDGTDLTINASENIEAVEAYKSVYDGSGFGKGQDASTYRAAFKAGQLGMAIDNSSAVMTLIGDAVAAEDIGASVLPFPGGGSAYAGFSIGVNANSENKELAKDWIRWLLTDDGQKEFANTLFPSAIATETTADQEKLDANPWVAAFQEQVLNSTGVIIPGYETDTSAIRTIVLTQISRVISEGISAKEALDTAQEQAESQFGNS